MTGKEYRTITDVKGPLVFLNKTEPVAFGEIVTLRLSNGTIKNGQVLDTSDDLVIVQVFEGTSKIDREAGVTFMGDVFKLPVSTDLVGRILDGAGRPVTAVQKSLQIRRKTSLAQRSTHTADRVQMISFRQVSLQSTCVRASSVARNYRSFRHLVSHTMTSLCKLLDKPNSRTLMKNSLLCSVLWESQLRNTTSSVQIWSEPGHSRTLCCSST